MSDIAVHGTVADGFEMVREEFRAILHAEGADLSAQVAAYHRGRPVVDLWAGVESSQDSLLGIYSASKGVTHIVAALLVQDGELDLDERVSTYWPEFAAGGKQHLLVRELLSHQAGVVGAVDGFSMDELADDQVVAERLAAQVPFWRPGATSGYHALVMAALSGEVIRRVSGRSVQSLYAERLRDPLQLELFLGLGEEQESRFLPAQPMIATPERLRDLTAAASAPDSLAGVAFNRHAPGNREVWELPNLPLVRANGTASFGGIGTARGLAKLYAALISSVDGSEPLFTPATAAAVAQIQTNGLDPVLGFHKPWAVGFHSYGQIYPTLAVGAFGHSGAGGQQALVDPANELSYAFLRRRFGLPAQVDTDHNQIIRALQTAMARA
ncbi:serine hydrolase domain-containing protein [Rudaeicoccus suwonensis]|uniref:CubicO group peptidase (Beta-lactamase class C family) n=1 Tax=Rudaeicoccus suwonensis TaxID=657409 RepID=A0A561E6P4_9MICO|nr:serine hydrolase domain-containing protein [Rudaeicoccus suwonensis]TWE11295.1 CubicO group peptidase (beta-lactamase class C family) [Rudaeicoccus suwonensis]